MADLRSLAGAKPGGLQLQQDGGDVEILDIKDNLIYCRLAGACAGCAGAGQTLKMMIEKTLKDMVDERIRVIAI